ncbi:hypothetical protein CROQUDRAFT_67719 [Cronartium quercuum f. sp. fusiforme G11]|uniref:Uncharacterized protein n=1 Tax=Cronartium quercuum f. sp. fusiforme G11 TaxID=708437 RepID=A0A9P6NAG2_9BASI|nr:hypothetical protein CROQUDRAFT_67719 [Cronartium quercuum f. sp. fusiforme G11]
MAGTSAILLCIAGFPGKSIGGCVQGLISALSGVGVGAFNFYLLAKVAHSALAQAFMFFVMVYLLGLLKASNPKWFAFSLLCILMSWNGISTTVNSPTRQFNSGSLISYLTAYLWGAAIVLFINVSVFPHTAEKELRMTLAASLDHCRTFACLLSKTYRLEIDEEETRVREDLAQSIRADFSILQTKMSETSVEIIWSKWSMSDYHRMVHKTRAMQQILTTVHTNLNSKEKLNVKDFRQYFLQGVEKELVELNQVIYCVFTELQKELAVGEQWESLNQKEAEDLKEFDLEQNAPHGQTHRTRTSSQNTSILEAEARLRTVQENLRAELSRPQRTSCSIETLASVAPVSGINRDIDPSTPNKSLSKSNHRNPSAQIKSTIAQSSLKDRLRISCAFFEEVQHRKISEFLASDRLHGPDHRMSFEPPTSSPPRAKSPRLMVVKEHEVSDESGSSPPLKPTESHEALTDQDRRRPSIPQVPPLEANPLTCSTQSSLSPTEETEIHQAFIRAFSYSFTMRNFVNEAVEMLEHVTGKLSDGSTRKKSLHFHFLEGLNLNFRTSKPQEGSGSNDSTSQTSEHDEKVELSMRQALDSLEGRPHVPTKISVLRWLIRLEEYLRGPDSICAFKTACAVIVLGILFWANHTRKFAISFSLTSGLITVVVAITPTLGQSWLSFVFQILGQGLGLIYTMIVLLIFKDVGGYRYNPYGLIAALALFAAPLCYILYSQPHLFILCLLALNSAGVLAYTEFLNRKHPFDTAPYRMSKNLTTLAIALGVVTLFQLLLFRNPAKRVLRKATAQVMKANTAYTIILQAYVKATISTDPAERPSPHALEKVYHDLIKRETQIQSQIVNLVPLIKFAGAEPSFVKPFNAKQYFRLVR